MHANATKRSISVETRDLGYGSEEYYGEAYVTDEVDTWGKRTILVDAGHGKYERWFLFDDEWSEA